MLTFTITTNDEKVVQVPAADAPKLLTAWRKWQAAPERMDYREWEDVLDAATDSVEIAADDYATDVDLEGKE